jgi:transmembrane sensor
MDESTDATAIGWVIRRDRAELGPEEERQLEAWLASDSRCRGALARAEAAWSILDRARALTKLEPEPASASASNVSERLPAFRRDRRRAFAIWPVAAAGMALLSFFALSRPDIETAVGEVRSIPLADGSVATVNTASRVQVSMEPDRRTVELERGEAWFHVSRDATRPFVVEAGRVRVQAVGTAFSVRKREGGADVLVTEGVVNAWVDGAESEKLRLTAGSKAFVSEDGDGRRVEQGSATVERDLAWRNGMIDLDGATLAQAAREFNRYNSRRLVVESEALAAEPVVGRFGLHEVEAFARAAAPMFGARAIVEEEQIRLVPLAER